MLTECRVSDIVLSIVYRAFLIYCLQEPHEVGTIVFFSLFSNEEVREVK